MIEICVAADVEYFYLTGGRASVHLFVGTGVATVKYGIGVLGHFRAETQRCFAYEPVV